MARLDNDGHDDGDDAGPKDAVEAIAAAVTQLTETLVLARVLVHAGMAVDLGGLEREVGDLCADAIALPRAEGRDMATPLADLLAEIELLERAMEDRPPTL
ncbi:hypothetical protein [Elioraea sp.]|uniref:hypothetical protein n=1 Tax=Elioraea sp. TaxID=2185103 RepID=UPI0025BAB850|nr:hypothetical protein [Elioraea sp.]